MPSTKPKFSILILTYRRSDLLQQRLEEIETHCRGDQFEVVVGDNDSPNREASLAVASFGLRSPQFPLRSIRIHPNAGFGRGFNEVMDHADGSYWGCLSDDVKVTGDLVAHLESVFPAVPDALVCQRIIDWQAGWNQFGEVTIPYPEGYFLAASEATWNRLGRFDPRFYPNDYEDVDIGRTALEKGVAVIASPSLPLLHIGAQTVGHSPERFRQTIAMRARFAEKWGLPNVPERP